MNSGTRSDVAHWDDVGVKFAQHDPSLTWRAYMQAVYRDLIQRWLVSAAPGAAATSGVTLKTDLFEEAVTPHHLFDALGPLGIGIDVSTAVVRAASRRLAAQGLMGECVRLKGQAAEHLSWPASKRRTIHVETSGRLEPTNFSGSSPWHQTELNLSSERSDTWR